MQLRTFPVVLAGVMAAMATISHATVVSARTADRPAGAPCVYSENLPQVPPPPRHEPPRFNHQRVELALASSHPCALSGADAGPGFTPTAWRSQ